MKFWVVDDGTLDTVIECQRCGAWERFNTDSLFDFDEEEYCNGDSILRALELAELSISPLAYIKLKKSTNEHEGS